MIIIPIHSIKIIIVHTIILPSNHACKCCLSPNGIINYAYHQFILTKDAVDFDSSEALMLAYANDLTAEHGSVAGCDEVYS